MRQSDSGRSNPRKKTPEHRASCVAALHVTKRQLAARLKRVSDHLDAALLASRHDRVLYAVLGQALQAAEGRPQTADDLARVERALRKATHKALRRLQRVNRDRDPGGNKASGDKLGLQPQHHDMTQNPTPYRRRIVEEWYSPGTHPDVEDLNDELAGDAFEDDEDDDQDHDLGDPDCGPAA